MSSERVINVLGYMACTVLALMLGLPAAGWLMAHGWQWALWAPLLALATLLLLHRPLLVLVLWLGIKT